MLNFKKSSNFSPGAEKDALPPEPEAQGGILAVWGAPGSGKTTVAAKIAKYVADQKRNTVLMLCDMTVTEPLGT